VLLISGQIPSDTLGKEQGELHEVDDQLDVFRPITKWNHRVTRVEEVPAAVHEAMRHLKTGRPRPVELEVPPDILATTGDIDLLEPEEYPRARGAEVDIRRAARILVEATSPAIIAGGGAMISDASDELLELAEHLQAPVMTTQQAKGILPEDHYLAAGVNYYGLGPIYRVAPESDVIIAVGTRLLINDFKLSDSQKVIHIDADPSVIGRNYPTEVGIEADAKEGLAQLLQAVRAIAPPKGSRRDALEGYKRGFRDEMRELAPRQLDVVDSVREALDNDAILVSGITNIGYWSNVGFPVRRPRSYLTTSYFATLGFAYPTALGAKVACPDRQVVALCGDGGFLFSPQELSTAAGYSLDVVAVVFNNSAYGASQWDQTHRYGRRHIGTDLHNPDFAKLAQAFGVESMRTDPEGLSDALGKALAAKAPMLLEVVLPNMMPPFQVVR